MTFDEALELAYQAHQGQVDKAGKPYFEHIIRVTNNVSTEQAKKLAVLHDILEDTEVTKEQLTPLLTEEELFILQCLTHHPNEPYVDYIERVKLHPVAVEVKVADLVDNADLTRIQNPTRRDHDRRQKYLKALVSLTSYRFERIRGTNEES